jgi:hypothetical protein
MKWMCVMVAWLCVVFFYSQPVNGQTRGTCADDVAKFCKGVQPGGGRLVKCLKDHESELSPACSASHEQAKAGAKEAHEACADDVQKLCKDVQPGKGRIVRCLKDHSKSLSTECRDKLKTAGNKPN